MRTYEELKNLKTFDERFDYLKLTGIVGEETFGWDRCLNQILYSSKKWKSVRDRVIIRDNGCDLGIEEFPIYSKIIVHHINPIRKEDITLENDDIFNENYLICVSHNTHNAIHYGNRNLLPKIPKERKKFDTIPWRKDVI